jgi:hypothetical protein
MGTYNKINDELGYDVNVLLFNIYGKMRWVRILGLE